MAYVKQTWINGVTGGTPISSTRLNYMETGIELVNTKLNTPTGTASTTTFARGDGTWAVPPGAGGGGTGLDGYGTTQGGTLVYYGGAWHELQPGSNADILTSDSTVTEGVRWATPATVVDDEVGSTISVATITAGTLPALTATGLEVPVNPGESWWIESELIYDASADAGIRVSLSGLGTVTNQASTAFAHGALRGIGVGGANKVVALYAGTIGTGGSAENTVVFGDFTGPGLGTPSAVTVNVKVKIGANVTPGAMMGLRFRQATLDSTVSTVNLYQGSWAIFSKAGV